MSDSVVANQTNVVRYLIELARLRGTTVYDLDNYHHVIWCCDIPQDPHCYTRAWGDSEDHDEDIWIEVRQRKEPGLPNAPEPCEPWLSGVSLRDSDREPVLPEHILPPIDDDDDEDEDDVREAVGTGVVDVESDDGHAALLPLAPQYLLLADHPEVQAAWNDYLEQQWRPWAEQHRRWRRVHAVYSQLFSLHQTLQKQGEQTELLIGLGLLRWNVNERRIRRHLITGRVDLNFDAKRGVFTVRPAGDGVKLAAELDMLDGDLRPATAAETSKAGLETAGENIWDRSSIDPVLTGITNLLSDQGEYHEDAMEPTPRVGQYPIVDFAPALILRKRSTRGVIEALEKIKDQIEQGCEAPDLWADLCETKDAGNPADDDRLAGDSGEESAPADPTIYFPLPSNEEQRRIISTIQSQEGALVQGPPGTGKSHTIANLICHLLATGQRILVTAQTPRALKVLQDKLPEPIKPLCVSLLGSGTEEQKSLEASVQGILTQQTQWHADEAEEKVQDCQRKRAALMRELAQLNSRRRALREIETHQHTLPGYTGTAAAIAKALEREKDEHGWIPDLIDPEQELPFPPIEFLRLAELIRSTTPERESVLRLHCPRIGEHLLDQDAFESLAQRRADAQRRLETVTATNDDSWKQQLARFRDPEVAALSAQMDALEARIATVRKRPLAWLDDAIYGILSEQDRPWIELHNSTGQILNNLRDRARLVDSYHTSVPVGSDRLRVRHDASELRQHLAQGKRLRFGPFRPAVVRKCLYLIEQAHVDGRPCDNIETLDRLIETIDVEQEVQRAWRLWEGRAVNPGGTLATQVADLEEHLEALTSVVEIYQLLESAKKAIAAMPGLPDPSWHEEQSRKALTDAARTVIADQTLAEVERHIRDFIDRLKIASSDATMRSDLIHEAINAAQNCDRVAYAQLLKHVSDAEQEQADYHWMTNHLTALRAVAPGFAAILAESADEPVWATRFNTIERAWDHARARFWLDQFLHEAGIDVLEQQIAQAERRIGDLIAAEASVRAWKFCFEELSETHRRYLVGWQQAMKKVGKGTGKHAPRHRRDAQNNLRQCRGAIPAWVMPLHRVFDTIDPEPGMFDVIIIDEASQCGPDSLPLFFMGRKVLVVGDDQQISPDHVGVNRDDAVQRREELLRNFQFKDAFDIDSSLFSQGERRLGNRIVLREHFRCMPEIIEFSNALCYQACPLIPLRQYPPNRLSPTVRRYIADGYREGTSQYAINRPEAEAVTRAIADCCADPQYTRLGQKLTMGVISLQGHAQARLIENLLLEEIGTEEFSDRQIICGDAYSFQGDERDVIFLSMVAASNQRIGPLVKGADMRRFNVAASRARDQLWLFHSATLNDLNQSCMRRALLQHFISPPTLAAGDLDINNLRQHARTANRGVVDPPAPFESWFEVDVALDIMNRGYRVVPQLNIAEYRIDLVVQGGQAQLAVECDGDEWHGADRYEKDLERQRKLERAGWQFRRVRGSAYYANRDEALRPLWDRLDEMGIRPLGLTAAAAPAGEQEDRDSSGFSEETGHTPYATTAQAGPDDVDDNPPDDDDDHDEQDRP